MQKLTFIFIILILATSCRSGKLYKIETNKVSDNVKVIDLENSFGVIFPAELEVYFLNKNKRFTPSKEQISKVESEIDKQYLEAQRKFIYEQVYVRTSEVYGDQEIDKQKTYSDIMDSVSKIAKRIPNYDRQYVGYVENGENIILINFIDFSKDPHNLEENLAKELIGGFHGWFQSNIITQNFNLNTNKLSVY
jgi:hypothetical protein